MSTPTSPNTFVTPSTVPAPKHPSGYYVRIEGNSFLVIDMMQAAGTTPIPASCKKRITFLPNLSRWAETQKNNLVSFIQAGCSRASIDSHIELLKANLKKEQDKIREKGEAISRTQPLTPEDHATVVELTQPPVDHTIADGLFRATGAGPTDQPSPADFRETPAMIYGKTGQEFRHTMKEILALIVAETNEERRRELVKKLEHATA